MKLLITGGLGFIGSNFVRYILNKYPDDKVVNLDIVTYCANFDNLKDIEDNPRYVFVKGDIGDKDLVDKIFREEKPNFVVNFAAASHVDRSILEPELFVKTNVVGTQTLLEAARKYGIEKFEQISTDEVYGTIEQGQSKEGDNLLPNSPYAASKAAADLLVRSYYKTFGLPVLTTRSSNNFGPYQYPEKVIPLFITNLLENKKVPLYGTGKNVRDWIYVGDNCSGIDIVLRKGRIGEIYNIGGGNQITNLELTKTILNELGRGDDCIEYVKDRPGHDFRYALDTSKVGELGWQARYPFNDAVKETIKWYQKNSEWWQRIKSGEYSEYYKKQYLERS